MKAWHFVGETLRDGRPIPPDGEWLEHDGPLVLCETGLHASVDPFDALQYAPGATLCRVEVAGTIIKGADKLVASRRRIIKRLDVTDLLRRFACDCALDVIHLWDAPSVVTDYLRTPTERAKAAAKDAAWDAALAAAKAAAKAAAWAAARDAAWDAARDAARAAAWDAARGAQRKRFKAMVSAREKEESK